MEQALVIGLGAVNLLGVVVLGSMLRSVTFPFCVMFDLPKIEVFLVCFLDKVYYCEGGSERDFAVSLQGLKSRRSAKWNWTYSVCKQTFALVTGIL